MGSPIDLDLGESLRNMFAPAPYPLSPLFASLSLEGPPPAPLMVPEKEDPMTQPLFAPLSLEGPQPAPLVPEKEDLSGRLEKKPIKRIKPRDPPIPPRAELYNRPLIRPRDPPARKPRYQTLCYDLYYYITYDMNTGLVVSTENRHPRFIKGKKGNN